MNNNVFSSISTSFFAKFPLATSLTTSALKLVQERTTTKERSQPEIKSHVDPGSDLYHSNVLNSSLKFTDELETSRTEAVKTTNETTLRKRLYWWF